MTIAVSQGTSRPTTPNSAGDATTNTTAPKIYKTYNVSWRIRELSKPKSVREKWTPEEPPLTTVSISALLAKCTERTEHLARPEYRNLVITKKLYKDKGEAFQKRMDQKINEAWNSMFNEWKRAKKAYKAKKRKEKRERSATRKGKPKAPHKSKEQRMAEYAAWIEMAKLPKKIPEPPPVDRGKKVENWDDLEEYLTNISQPRNIIPKYSLDEPYWMDTGVRPISEAALTYEISDRIAEIAQCPEKRKTIKVEEPPIVSPAALKYQATPRIQELAVPKKRAKAQEEVREDAFTISPNALLYKPSPRILELAKPVER